MSKYSITTAKQLIDEVGNSDLYPQFMAQVQKDLNRAGIDYTIKSKKPQELFPEIGSLLIEKLQNAFNEYINLLYAVDVSEVEIKNLRSEDSVDIAEYATYLILKREWQKVWYRNKL
ncbi:hypothetical protein [Aquimarina sediminis]|uniref:hypothetical protein n=1 Tax=Aquimarina sediminis TaxID=2070536 RepID=UPI000CA08D3C|nr:hypothetical protein [Aquimarina sediminis]